MLNYKKSQVRSRAVPATIIPFPRPPVAAAETPQQRLARALAGLCEAQAAQQTAIAQWRASLSDLQASTASLGQSLDSYSAGLGLLAGNVSGVQTQMRDLEAWADGVLATGAAGNG